MSLLQGFTQAIRIDLQGSSNLGSTVGSATAELDRFANSAKRLGVLGGILTGIGAAMTGFAAMTAGATIRSQEALGEMASLGYQDLNLLENAAAAFSSQFAGTSKSDFIKAAYDIKSGIASLSDEGVASFTRLSAMTARATKSTVTEMTSLFATAYGIYKGFYAEMSDAQFGELFSGGLATAVQQFKTTGPAMAMAISRLGATATTAMIPMEEQLAVLGMLQATMSGEQAGTKYKQFMLNTARAGQQLGLSFTNAHGQLLPMAEILDTLKQKFGQTIDAAEKLEIQQAFGTVEALAVVDLLIGRTGDLRSNIDALSAAMAGGSSVTLEMAQAMDRGLGPVLALTKQRLSNALEELGKPLAGMIGPALDRISSMVEAFRAWAETHPGLVKLGMGITLIGGVVMTLAGGVLLAGAAFGTMASGIIGAAVAMGIGSAGTITLTGAVVGLGTAIWSALAPILPMVAALVAVGGVFYLAWKGNFLGIRDAVVLAFNNIKAAFDTMKRPFLLLWDTVKSLLGGWIDSIRLWYESWNGALSGASSPLVRFVETASYGIGYLHGLFYRFIEWMQPAFVAGFEVLKNSVVMVWEAISGTFQIGLALIRGDWAGAWVAMKTTSVGLFTNLRELLTSHARFFATIWDMVGGVVTRALTGIWDGIKTVFLDPLRGFIEWVAPAFHGAFQIIQQVVSTVWEAILGVFQIGMALIRSDWDGAWDAMKETATQLFVNLQVLMERYAAFFSTIWGMVGQQITTAFTRVWDSLKTGFFGLMNFFIEGINGLTSALNLIPGIDIPALDRFGQTNTGDFSSGTSSFVSNAISSVNQSSRSVQVDRSIHGISLNINTPAGADTGSLREAFLQALEELAGQSDGIEEVVIDAG